jgi:hypothetical protein
LDVVKQQLQHQPVVTTRNRKQLDVGSADFEFVAPIWELRVGEFRVFYDVSEADATVYVRAVRRKGPESTTKDVLHERDTLNNSRRRRSR